LGGYYILRWANGGSDEPATEEQGPTIGDRLNKFSGGRLTGFMGEARREQSKGDIKGYGNQYTPVVLDGADGNVGPKVSEGVNGVHGGVSKGTSATGTDAVANTTGTVKGGLSGVTGLG
jgi:hypothetical protein